jgi:hypothetical protein
MLKCMAVSSSQPRTAGEPLSNFFDGLLSYVDVNKIGGLAEFWERGDIRNPPMGMLGFQNLCDGVACLLIDITREEDASFFLFSEVPHGTSNIALQHFPVKNLGALLSGDSSLK